MNPTPPASDKTTPASIHSSSAPTAHHPGSSDAHMLQEKLDLDNSPRSHEIYQSLVNSINGIVWEVDAKTFQFTFVSSQAEAILGYSVAKWLEPDFWVQHVYSPDLEAAMHFCQTATQEHRNHEFEYRMVAADGHLVWIKDVVTVIVENQQPTLLRGVMFDITDQKQTETALQEQQLQLEMALDAAQMATWDWNLVNNEVKCSNNIASVLGLPERRFYSPFELWEKTVHPEDYERVQSAIRRSLAGHESYSVEFRTTWQDGSEHWVSSRGRLLLNEQAQPIRMIGVTLDVTQQKQSEERLRQSHHFLQTVLDNLPVAVSVKDGRKTHFGTYTFWNKTCEQLFGIPAAQAIGKTVFDCFSEENAALMQRQDQQTFEHQVSENILEHSVPTENGEERLLHTVKVPVFDEQKNPQYLLCISEDITDQKRAEQALQQRIERESLIGAITNDIRQSLDLKEILNTTVAKVRQFLQTDRVVIFRFRPSWSGIVLVESVTSNWTSILGRVFHDPCFSESFVTLYEQGHISAIADTNQASLPECFARLLRSLQVQAMLTVPIKQQGKLWGLLIAHHCSAPRIWQPFEIELLEQLVGQVGIAIKQSELYQQVSRLNSDLERQMQIRTAELQLASEFEATLKRITDRVRDSLDEDQILQTAVRELAVVIGVTGCNAALYDLDSRTSKVSYEYTDSLVPLQGRVVQMDNFPEGYRQLIQGQHFQFCSLIPNPLRGHVAMLACPIVDDKGVLGDLWLVSQKYRAFNDQDIRLVQQVANQCAIAIRQARLYQKAQAQVKELEKLNRLKDDFLSTVSHELRTPMANIKMATQMLEVILFNTPTVSLTQNTDSPALQKALRYFQILKDECQREINLINDLLDLSRVETGIDVPTLVALNLESWLPQLIHPFIERARNQQQQLQLDLPSLPPIVTDSSRLERIVGELLNNACKYTPAGGKIAISAKIAHSEPLSNAGATVFQLVICNSGVEISPEELTRIFDKFYRVPNNDPWKHGGTGLGLALVKKLLEPMDGTIQATSSNGSTCFVVQLPVLNSEKTGAQDSLSPRRTE
ncbi:MAG: PAS domain-containing protein [Leptolyngbyaceae cyanobacterium bins.302]|nr:PAS domain-containing protein [Leptolyngbyaceae cyanobacterium bins.302]